MKEITDEQIAMELDPSKLNDIKLGMMVEILDLHSRELMQGKIMFIISQSDHPEGILVKLDAGNKGHIKKIMRTTIDNNPESMTEEIELLPEQFNLEYKSSFKYHGDDVTKSWLPSFAVFKAISGFANAEGGKVIIGVKDEKNKPLRINGLKMDFELIGKLKIRDAYYSSDQDGMNLRIIHEFRHYFPKQELVKNLVKISFHGNVSEKMVCIIDVTRSPDAVIMYDSMAPDKKCGPYFFVRVNNQTIPYEPYDFCRYWARHNLGMLGR